MPEEYMLSSLLKILNLSILDFLLQPDLATVAPIINVNLSNGVPTHVLRGTWASILPSRKWELHSIVRTENLTLSDTNKKKWEVCKQALSAFKFSVEEEDKILGKAFGQIHSPYWGEEREKVVPTYELVNEILDYLRSLSLLDDDLAKLLKKFPEVLGCNLKHELKTNVQVLEKE
ncbi:hypothetical protein U1Q18_031380 [Sarracenia purpurea var. burkii]